MNWYKKAQIDDSYERPYPVSRLSDRTINCPIHRWRAETGIELIHQEPDLQEFQRIVKNWNKMTDEQKKMSDQKSIELFSRDNMSRVQEIYQIYADDKNELV